MKSALGLFVGSLLMSFGALAADLESAAHDPVQCSPNGVALGGHDVVSYHAAGGPVKGVGTFVAEHDGLQYLFSSEESRDAFVLEPDRYLPSYRGWCATALSFGGFVCPDYTNFKIEDGKLFLFETTGFTNGRTLWNSDPMAFRKRADDNYLGLVGPK